MNKNINLKYFCLIAVIILAVFSSIGLAKEDIAKNKETITNKEVQGEISGIGKDYISVIYKKDEEKGVDYEILLPIEHDISLNHKQNLGELKPGDIVRIQYQETTQQTKNGPKSSRKAKIINFVKSGKN